VLTSSSSSRDAVVSLDHESLVNLFRKEGRLAVELLRACAKIKVDHARVAVTSIDLSQVTPIEYRADTVVVLTDRKDRPVAGVIVEVQLEAKPDKLRTWPAYVAILRAELGCAAVLLVIAPDPRVARWARRRIELGHPGFQLTPIVIGFDNVPWVRDRAAALALPQLAVLSAMAHPTLEAAEVAIVALSQLPGDQKQIYLDIILTALPAKIRRTLEGRMQSYQYQSDFARKYYGVGLEEGLEKGLKKGLEKGREKGRSEGLRDAVVALARNRIDDLSEDTLAALDMVSDPYLLTQLITTLGETRTVIEARAVVDRLRPKPGRPKPERSKPGRSKPARSKPARSRAARSRRHRTKRPSRR
jgi:hypothetical protein